MDQDFTGATTTAVPSPETSSSSNVDGTWGERDAGGPVSHRVAMEDYEEMRKQLSHLSQTRSAEGSKAIGKRISRTKSSRSKRSRSRGAHTIRSHSTASEGFGEKDLEAGDAEDIVEKEEEFQLAPFIKEGHFERRTETGASAKKVGVTFRHLTVKGIGSTTNYVRTLFSAILGTFGPDLYHIICNYIPALRCGSHPPRRTLIHDFTGVVRDGEMMLVLGRPGSGCTTLLKAIANQRGEYAEVTGDVRYGGIPADKQDAQYRGEVNYNPEDDQHFPALNVWQTLKFSLLNKTKQREKGEIDVIIRALLSMFGISHTSKTLVGNEYVHGVSGGERKRVSIAETLATKSTVVCWFVHPW